jgi:hypothetical protein
MIGDGCWFVGVASALRNRFVLIRLGGGRIDRLKYEYTPGLKL